MPDNCWQTKSRNAVSVALLYLEETMADHPAVFTSDFADEAISWEASAPQRRSASCWAVCEPAQDEAVAELPRLSRETRGLS